MELNVKKVNPKDVFESALTKEEQKWRTYVNINIPYQRNKPSGNEFIDALADLISLNMLRTSSFYERLMGLKTGALRYFMSVNSDLDFSTWRNQYVLLAAKELLAETDCSLTEIGKRLGFSGANTFSRWFIKVCGEKPSWWRYMAKHRKEQKEKAEAEDIVRKAKAAQLLAKYAPKATNEDEKKPLQDV